MSFLDIVLYSIIGVIVLNIISSVILELFGKNLRLRLTYKKRKFFNWYRNDPLDISIVIKTQGLTNLKVTEKDFFDKSGKMFKKRGFSVSKASSFMNVDFTEGLREFKCKIMPFVEIEGTNDENEQIIASEVEIEVRPILIRYNHFSKEILDIQPAINKIESAFQEIWNKNISFSETITIAIRRKLLFSEILEKPQINFLFTSIDGTKIEMCKDKINIYGKLNTKTAELIHKFIVLYY